MSQVMQYAFRLFGPRKGQTVLVNGHQFVAGELVLTQSSENMASCAKVLSYYGAYHRGSPEYDKAMAAEVAVEAEGSISGTDEVQTVDERGSNKTVQRNTEQDGAGPAKEQTARSSGHAASATDNARHDAQGDRHEDSGVPKFEEEKDRRAPTEPSSSVNEAVKAAVLKLDPEEDSQWVATGAHAGKPKLSAVEDAYGKAGLARQDVEAVLPGYTRDHARQAAK